jgi:hypothetical protein
VRNGFELNSQGLHEATASVKEEEDDKLREGKSMGRVADMKAKNTIENTGGQTRLLHWLLWVML